MDDNAQHGDSERTLTHDRPASDSLVSANSIGPFTPGTLLAGRYRIVAPLGSGGVAEVYRAEDTKLGQTVALKFITQRIASEKGLLERIVTEVRIGRQVSHPNLCRIYDMGEVENQYFITMEYVDGENLAPIHRQSVAMNSDACRASGAFTSALVSAMSGADGTTARSTAREASTSLDRSVGNFAGAGVKAATTASCDRETGGGVGLAADAGSGRDLRPPCTPGAPRAGSSGNAMACAAVAGATALAAPDEAFAAPHRRYRTLLAPASQVPMAFASGGTGALPGTTSRE